MSVSATKGASNDVQMTDLYQGEPRPFPSLESLSGSLPFSNPPPSESSKLSGLMNRVNVSGTAYNKQTICDISFHILLDGNAVVQTEGQWFYPNLMQTKIEMEALLHAICMCTAEIPPEHLNDEVIQKLTDLMHCQCFPLKDAWAQILKTLRMTPPLERAELILCAAPIYMHFMDGFKRERVLRLFLEMPQGQRASAATCISEHFQKMPLETNRDGLVALWEKIPGERRLVFLHSGQQLCEGHSDQFVQCGLIHTLANHVQEAHYAKFIEQARDVCETVSDEYACEKIVAELSHTPFEQRDVVVQYSKEIFKILNDGDVYLFHSTVVKLLGKASPNLVQQFASDMKTLLSDIQDCRNKIRLIYALKIIQDKFPHSGIEDRLADVLQHLAPFCQTFKDAEDRIQLMVCILSLGKNRGTAIAYINDLFSSGRDAGELWSKPKAYQKLWLLLLGQKLASRM